MILKYIFTRYETLKFLAFIVGKKYIKYDNFTDLRNLAKREISKARKTEFEVTCRRRQEVNRESRSSAGYLWLHTAIAARCFFVSLIPFFSFLPFSAASIRFFFFRAESYSGRHYREYRS